MENKKQQQSNFTRSKACQPTDSLVRKSPSDLDANKLWPRNSRRREQPSSTRSDSQRNSKQYTSIKTRPNVDKRPRHRVGGGGNKAGNVYAADNNEDGLACTTDNVPVTSTGLANIVEPVVTGALAKKKSLQYVDYKLNSVYMPGSKKQNLNHLLNFHYAPRDADNAFSFNVFGRSGGSGATGATHRHGGNSGASKRHRYNKEQFLQANFQFVIKSGVNLSICASPDNLIDWHLIEQINIQTEEEPQCPICLYPPIAAKLTRCGHVFCWPCILHYLALSDKTWRKCPICYEAIHTADLKSTTIIQQRQFNIGDEITFQLMRRKKGCMMIEKFEANTNRNELDSYPLLSAGEESKFSKFLYAKRNDILKIIDREQRELVVGQDPTCPEYVFIQQALDLLKERREKVEEEMEEEIESKNEMDLLDECERVTTEIENIKIEDDENYNAEGGKNVESLQNMEDIDASNSEGSISNEDTLYNISTLTLSSAGGEKLSGKYYYFYQSVDGQNIYLHPLNVKMLQACYGTLEHAPSVISALVLQKEHHSMDEEHRRKFTCLSHLPLTCQFAIIEVDLQPPFVSSGILRLFREDILTRKKERQRREREESRRERKINEINDRQMGKFIASTTNLNLTSAHEFPTWGFEEALPSVGGVENAPNSKSTDIPKIKRQATYSTVAVVGGESPNTSEYWPTLSSPRNNSNNMYKELSTWGKSAICNTTNRNINSERSSECESLEESLADNDFTSPKPTDLGDVLAMAISQKKPGPAATNAGHAGGMGGKKSKKAKKMVPLFSTGINNAGK